MRFLVVCACFAWGCSGSQDKAAQNRTFYDWSSPTAGAGDFEQPYPPLDWAAPAPLPEYIGVTVLHQAVHFSRPRNWVLRDGNNQPGQSFIQYISPNAYSFAIYERVDPRSDDWREILQRYEDDTSSVGAKVAGGRVPMATFEGQGRAYSVEREVEAAKKPLASRSREYVVRGRNRVVLVQIVHEGDDLSGIDQELMRAVQTLQVL